MIARVLLSIAAVVLIAAKPAPVAPVAPPGPSIVPPPEVVNDPQNRLTLQLSNGGSVVVLLRPDIAPQHVERMRNLARNGFYDGLTFHRVIPGFMSGSTGTIFWSMLMLALAGRATSTLFGSLRNFWASFWIGGGIVAEKSRVCRLFGSFEQISSISGMKPMVGLGW